MRIAVTGGIGSGKSYVCKALATRGIEVYDCDSAAKRLMHASPALRESLTSLIGNDAYDTGGRLNKAVVARFLLQSESNAMKLNATVHPAVARDFLSSGSRWMECAILFESGFDALVDVKVCVTAPMETRLSRMMQRDGITREKALEWISRQMSQEDVAQRCDYVINNDGKMNIEQQIDKLLNDINRINHN